MCFLNKKTVRFKNNFNTKEGKKECGLILPD